MNIRVRKLNNCSFHSSGTYVIYRMQVNRRSSMNAGFDFAIETANKAGLPVLVLEECVSEGSNDRFHTFVLEGVPENANNFRKAGAGYLFHLAPTRINARKVFLNLAEKAFAVIADDYPVSDFTEENEQSASAVDCAYQVVDSSCIVPMNELKKREYAAYTIRPKINRLLSQYLQYPEKEKLKNRWKESQPFPEFHTEVEPAEISGIVAGCRIDHSVTPSREFRGGVKAATERLRYFLKNHLYHYGQEKNEPSSHATSNLSPYLHFGYISALEVALAVKEYAEEHKLFVDEFLEELIVRRELAFNYARYTDRHDQLSNLPDWAQATLKKHDQDPRSYIYSQDEFEQSLTHDELWNACQRELWITGKIHGYYRMYWGKKIIEWSASHQHALEIMVNLHDKYALDGRHPNTYTNILWCFGLHDRPWFERPIFGQIRWMSLEGMRRKTDVDSYIREIAKLG